MDRLLLWLLVYIEYLKLYTSEKSGINLKNVWWLVYFQLSRRACPRKAWSKRGLFENFLESWFSGFVRIQLYRLRGLFFFFLPSPSRLSLYKHLPPLNSLLSPLNFLLPINKFLLLVRFGSAGGKLTSSPFSPAFLYNVPIVLFFEIGWPC